MKLQTRLKPLISASLLAAFSISATLAVSAAAFADNTAPTHPAPQRPAALSCASNGVGAAKQFRLDGFDTLKPETDLDAEIDGTLDVNPMTTTFCANNGCDDNYCFVFFTDDLDQMAKGKTSSVRAMMNYFNADLETAEAQTVSIECKVAAGATGTTAITTK